jgi:transposase
MPAPVPVPVRQAMFQRSRKGASVASLADEFELSERTVRHLVRRFDERGPSGLVPDYARCATKSATNDSAVRHKALPMRAQHPHWGGGLIRVLLQQEPGACPSARTQRALVSPSGPDASTSGTTSRPGRDACSSTP